MKKLTKIDFLDNKKAFLISFPVPGRVRRDNIKEDDHLYWKCVRCDSEEEAAILFKLIKETEEKDTCAEKLFIRWLKNIKEISKIYFDGDWINKPD